MLFVIQSLPKAKSNVELRERERERQHSDFIACGHSVYRERERERRGGAVWLMHVCGFSRKQSPYS